MYDNNQDKCPYKCKVCGHSTLSTHYTLAAENVRDTSRFYHKTCSEILPADILKENEDYKTVITQNKIEFTTIIDSVNKKYF